MKISLRVAWVLAWLLASHTGAWAVGNDLTFTAANTSYVQFARPATVQDDFTIEYWVNTTMTGPAGTNWYNGAGLVDGEMPSVLNDFGTSLLNGKLAFGVGNPDVTIQSTTTINDGKWHHVAVTRVKTTGLMTIYIDGVQEATSAGITTSKLSLTAATNLRMGSLQTGAPYFTGQLDEVRIWSVVRTQAQLVASKNYVVASGTANLAAYYRLDEAAGLTAAGTGAGANGSLMPTTTPPTWTVSTAPIYNLTNTITGTVFDDVNYGGGAGRSLATAANSAAVSGLTTPLGRSGVRVELYSSGGVLTATATTDASGFYGFSNLNSAAYTVRVVSSTVSAARTGGTTAGLLPVVTYQNGAADQVGGPNPALPDAPGNTATTPALLANLTTTTQAVEARSTATATNTGVTSSVDFGFNFDLIVNTKASGQGSLAQFITNSNALGDETLLAQAGSYFNQIVGSSTVNTALPPATETSIFMIPNGGAHAGLRAADGSGTSGPASQLTNGVAAISLSSAASILPTLTGPGTVLNGWTQSFNVGNTNDVTLGTGGSTGVNNIALPQLNGPEVQLAGGAAIAIGLNLTGAGEGVTGLAIYGFGNAGDSDANANIRTAANQITLLANLIGASATAFALPTGGSNADGVRAASGTGLTITNNLIGYNTGKGLTTVSGVTGATITLNELRSNAAGNAGWAGLDVQGSASSVRNNLSINNAGVGLDGLNSAGSNEWTGNTVTGNGAGTAALAPAATAGIRLFGAGNTVGQNVVTNNYGAGILLAPAVTGTTISQNTIYGNGSVKNAKSGAASGQIGIDLLATGQDTNFGTSSYVTPNAAATGGANSLINFPVLTSAVVSGSTLTVKGTATTGRTVEIFLATPNSVASPSATTGNAYGQGSSFLSSAVTTASPFTISVSLTGLTADQRTALTTPGARLTSTATLASTGTSEFSANYAVTSTPIANDVTNLKVGAGSAAATLNPGLTVPQAASDPVNSIASFTVNAATGGTLTFKGATVTTATLVLVTEMDQLTFKPTATTGNATFTFTATNSAGTGSNSATYTIPIVTSNAFITNDDGLDAAKNTATAGNVLLNDINSSPTTTFTVSQVSLPTHGTLAQNKVSDDGSYTYTPATDYIGSDSFTYKVCSTADCSNTATVTINVYDPTQVCSSANGPNILQNPGFEAGNDGSFTSAYNYISPTANAATTGGNTGLNPETTYAIDVDASVYHNGSAFTGRGRGGSGNFMIVNGDAKQSKVYAQSISVVPNRYYSFSGYGQSVNSSSPAKLGFVINGKSASVATTLSATVGTYQQFSGVWYSGSSTTATFEVRDINRDTGGNDFGIDDLYFGTCSVSLQVVNVKNATISYQAPPTSISPLQATLTNPGVSVASFMMQTVPSIGTLRLGGPNGTLVVAGQVISNAQRSALYYAPNGNAAGNDTFTYTAVDSEGAGSNNIATFTIPVSPGPLPVSLTAFSARATEAAAQLDWTTASELRNAYFAVERSTTGQATSFVTIGRLAGQGTVTAPTPYHFTDRNAAAVGQLVYYRLRQVDENGASTYSPVRVVSFEAGSGLTISLYPNPTAGAGTSLDLSALPSLSTYQVRLLDATGRTVRQWELPGGQPQPLEVTDLATGTYLVLVSGLKPDGSPLRQVLHLTKN